MLGSEEKNAKLAVIRKAIRSFLSDCPNRYDSTTSAIRRVNAVVLEEYAHALQPIFNDRIRKMPRATLGEKKQLAIWLNAQLREFGLAIRCPKTGHATSLQVNPTNDPEIGRFRLDRIDERGRRTTTFTAIDLPELELRPNDHHLNPIMSRGGRSR